MGAYLTARAAKPATKAKVLLNIVGVSVYYLRWLCSVGKGQKKRRSLWNFSAKRVRGKSAAGDSSNGGRPVASALYNA